MHFSWSQHLQLARSIGAAGDQDCGAALALMGVGMVLLLRELKHEMHQNRWLNVDIPNGVNLYCLHSA